MYERLLRPDRPRLAEAQKVVENLYDAREAWEALAARGLIPMEWIDQDTRSYIIDSNEGARRGYFPPSVRMALSLACDVAMVKAAEEIARRTATDIRNPQRVVWRCIRAENVNGYRDTIARSLRDGNVQMPPELVQTGYLRDPFHVESLMLLVPEIPAG